MITSLATVLLLQGTLMGSSTAVTIAAINGTVPLTCDTVYVMHKT